MQDQWNIEPFVAQYREQSRIWGGVMRDDEDPGTLEMKLPRKRGRPPKHGVAMTEAQRASSYRQ
jgi:hypothetical protein